MCEDSGSHIRGSRAQELFAQPWINTEADRVAPLVPSHGLLLVSDWGSGLDHRCEHSNSQVHVGEDRGQ